MFLTPTSAVFSVPVPSATASGQGQSVLPERDAFAMQLTGANANPQLIAQNLLLSTSNYFSGNDSTQWHADVPNYGAVEYDNVYPGINLVYGSVNTRQFEYQFVVQPDARSRRIQQTWQGVSSVSLDKQRQPGPADTGWRRSCSRRRRSISWTPAAPSWPWPSRRRSAASTRPASRSGTYDPSKPLIIDPALVY